MTLKGTIFHASGFDLRQLKLLLLHVELRVFQRHRWSQFPCWKNQSRSWRRSHKNVLKIVKNHRSCCSCSTPDKIKQGFMDVHPSNLWKLWKNHGFWYTPTVWYCWWPGWISTTASNTYHLLFINMHVHLYMSHNQYHRHLHSSNIKNV